MKSTLKYLTLSNIRQQFSKDAELFCLPRVKTLTKLDLIAQYLVSNSMKRCKISKKDWSQLASLTGQVKAMRKEI